MAKGFIDKNFLVYYFLYFLFELEEKAKEGRKDDERGGGRGAGDSFVCMYVAE